MSEGHDETEEWAAGRIGQLGSKENPQVGSRDDEKHIVRRRPDSGWTVDRFIQVVMAAAGVAAVVLTVIGH